VRKIIYIVIIAVLLIPLAMISRPEVAGQDDGGILSRMRREKKLTQAELTKIDPASETMKLASLGLRGVAINLLWMQSIEHKKEEDYDKLAATLKALAKIQPNFVKVWEYQAHNLAYNVSMEFDDYEYRYQWVKKGLDFLKNGVKYNVKDHRMTDLLGFMTGNKFGKSDEKKSFRRMFKKDDKLHESLSDMVPQENYDVDIFGPDSWLLAYQWYDLSNRLVDDQGEQKYKNDVMFYMFRPAQIRNRGLSLQEEHRTDDVIQEVWQYADTAWKDYGNREILNGFGIPFRMEESHRRREDIKRLRKELDQLTPGARAEQVAQIQQETTLTPREKMLLDLPADQRTDEQERQVNRLVEQLQDSDQYIDAKIARKAQGDDQMVAVRLSDKILELVQLEKTESKDSRNVNYDFWRSRNEAEAKDLTISARQALYDARRMRRASIYDDEFDVDYVTKERTSTKKGALSLYLDAFGQWSEVFRLYPNLQDSPLSDDIAEEMHQYQTMLGFSNQQWPDNFPLQWLIDVREKNGEPDTLPTSEELEELRTGREQQ
jgi:hypothetical protein